MMYDVEDQKPVAHWKSSLDYRTVGLWLSLMVGSLFGSLWIFPLLKAITLHSLAKDNQSVDGLKFSSIFLLAYYCLYGIMSFSLVSIHLDSAGKNAFRGKTSYLSYGLLTLATVNLFGWSLTGFFGLVKLPNPLLLIFSNEMYIFGWFIERHYLFVYLWSLYRSRVKQSVKTISI